MVNTERPDEVDARAVFLAVTGVVLLHADMNGEADYISEDGTVAVEVTSVTDEAAKAARGPTGRLLGDQSTSAALLQCWLVTVDDRHPRMNGLPDRVVPMLRTLSEHSVPSVWRRSRYMFSDAQPEVQEAVRSLLRNGIDHAVAPPELCKTDPHEHRIVWTAGGGGTAGSSEDALAAIEDDLNERLDNFRKLANSGATSTHLFVWIDSDTPFRIARALRDAPSADGFDIPNRPPQLSHPVGDLWIVHRETRNGWWWNGSQWNAIRA
jgi:hypothetical protein